MMQLKLAPQFLAAVNGTLCILLISILIIFIIYIFRELIHKIKTQGFLEGLRIGYQNRTAAISCFVFFSGDLIIRTTVWWRRQAESDDNTLMVLATTIGVIICIFGAVCILRHFAPRKDTNWTWIVTVAIALAFGIGTAL